MGRLKNEDKAKFAVAKRVSMVMKGLQILRAIGVENSNLLSDKDLQKMRITITREAEATIDAIEMQKLYVQEKMDNPSFKF
jgi:hypothetical protein